LIIKIRRAEKSDKNHILSFCSNTFSWGDYIDDIWDSWYAEKRSGQLLVAEYYNEPIALSHVAICPDKKSIWLEGLRVHPSHRRSKVASNLIEKMIEYGRKQGANQASAIVASENLPSQRMMEKNGFEVISRWTYYSVDQKKIQKQKSDARSATTEEFENIWRYLEQSPVYQLSAKRYAQSWHWYMLDRKTLRNFIDQGCVVVAGKTVDGIALTNRCSYMSNTNVLQIVYLDSTSASSLKHLISFAINLYIDDKFDRLQIICADSEGMKSFVDASIMKEQEEFLLYSKIFTE
jgi:ribosomal protein S18 acetylase RimI-like enzyme